MTYGHRDRAEGGSLPLVAADLARVQRGLRGSLPAGAPAALRRAVVAVLATVLLLGWGVVDLPRAAAAHAAAAGTSAPTPQDAMQVPAETALVRPGGPAVVPGPASPGAGLLPGHRPYAAPHLHVEPQSAPQTDRPAAAAVAPGGSRAPPPPAGT